MRRRRLCRTRGNAPALVGKLHSRMMLTAGQAAARILVLTVGAAEISARPLKAGLAVRTGALHKKIVAQAGIRNE